jgi:hypothetical protein
MSTATTELSKDQVESWHRDGFLVLHDFVDDETGANRSTDRPRRAYIFNIATKRAFERRSS